MFGRTRRSRVVAVVVLSAVYTAAGVAIGRVACVSSAMLESRHGLRAVLLMPGEFRAFAVEEHAAANEAFEYTMAAVADDRTRWRLRIDTSGQRTAFWTRVLAEHLHGRGFRDVRRPWRAGGRLSVLTAPGNRVARVLVQSDHVTFEYWPNLGRGRPRQPIALIRYYAFKLKRALLGQRPAVNTRTGPS